jgi:hypothetical protein
MSDWISQNDLEFHNPIVNPDNFSGHNFSGGFLPCLAFEIDRWACASIESFAANPSRRASKKSLAWDIVRCYYASYYAAHAIVRMCGDVIVHIDHENTRTLQRLAQISFPTSIRPSTGYYVVRYRSQQQELQFSRNTVQNLGSHHFLWRMFRERLQQILASPTATATGYQSAILSITNLVEVLSRDGNLVGQWLSNMRNDVNYKLSHGVWYPYEGSISNKHYESIMTQLSTECISTTGITLTRRTDPLIDFAPAVRFIIGLMHELLLDMRERCTMGASFLSHGAMRLLKKLNNAA